MSRTLHAHGTAVNENDHAAVAAAASAAPAADPSARRSSSALAHLPDHRSALCDVVRTLLALDPRIATSVRSIHALIHEADKQRVITPHMHETAIKQIVDLLNALDPYLPPTQPARSHPTTVEIIVPGEPSAAAAAVGEEHKQAPSADRVVTFRNWTQRSDGSYEVDDSRFREPQTVQSQAHAHLMAAAAASPITLPSAQPAAAASSSAAASPRLGSSVALSATPARNVIIPMEPDSDDEEDAAGMAAATPMQEEQKEPAAQIRPAAAAISVSPSSLSAMHPAQEAANWTAASLAHMLTAAAHAPSAIAAVVPPLTFSAPSQQQQLPVFAPSSLPAVIPPAPFNFCSTLFPPPSISRPTPAALAGPNGGFMCREAGCPKQHVQFKTELKYDLHWRRTHTTDFLCTDAACFICIKKRGGKQATFGSAADLQRHRINAEMQRAEEDMNEAEGTPGLAFAARSAAAISSSAAAAAGSSTPQVGSVPTGMHSGPASSSSATPITATALSSLLGVRQGTSISTMYRNKNRLKQKLAEFGSIQQLEAELKRDRADPFSTFADLSPQQRQSAIHALVDCIRRGHSLDVTADVIAGRLFPTCEMDRSGVAAEHGLSTATVDAFFAAVCAPRNKKPKSPSASGSVLFAVSNDALSSGSTMPALLPFNQGSPRSSPLGAAATAAAGLTVAARDRPSGAVSPLPSLLTSPRQLPRVPSQLRADDSMVDEEDMNAEGVPGLASAAFSSVAVPASPAAAAAASSPSTPKAPPPTLLSPSITSDLPVPFLAPQLSQVDEGDEDADDDAAPATKPEPIIAPIASLQVDPCVQTNLPTVEVNVVRRPPTTLPVAAPAAVAASSSDMDLSDEPAEDAQRPTLFFAPSSASSSSSAAAAAPTVVHLGVSCNGCKKVPIRGTRYRCSVCPVNLCELCEFAGTKHAQDHKMIKRCKAGDGAPTSLVAPAAFVPAPPAVAPHSPPSAAPTPVALPFGDAALKPASMPIALVGTSAMPHTPLAAVAPRTPPTGPAGDPSTIAAAAPTPALTLRAATPTALPTTPARVPFGGPVSPGAASGAAARVTPPSPKEVRRQMARKSKVDALPAPRPSSATPLSTLKLPAAVAKPAAPAPSAPTTAASTAATSPAVVPKLHSGAILAAPIADNDLQRLADAHLKAILPKELQRAPLANDAALSALNRQAVQNLPSAQSSDLAVNEAAPVVAVASGASALVAAAAPASPVRPSLASPPSSPSVAALPPFQTRQQREEGQEAQKEKVASAAGSVGSPLKAAAGHAALLSQVIEADTAAAAACQHDANQPAAPTDVTAAGPKTPAKHPPSKASPEVAASQRAKAVAKPAASAPPSPALAPVPPLSASKVVAATFPSAAAASFAVHDAIDLTEDDSAEAPKLQHGASKPAKQMLQSRSKIPRSATAAAAAVPAEPDVHHTASEDEEDDLQAALAASLTSAAADSLPLTQNSPPSAPASAAFPAAAVSESAAAIPATASAALSSPASRPAAAAASRPNKRAATKRKTVTEDEADAHEDDTAEEHEEQSAVPQTPARVTHNRAGRPSPASAARSPAAAAASAAASSTPSPQSSGAAASSTSKPNPKKKARVSTADVAETSSEDLFAELRGDVTPTHGGADHSALLQPSQQPRGNEPPSPSDDSIEY